MADARQLKMQIGNEDDAKLYPFFNMNSSNFQSHVFEWDLRLPALLVPLLVDLVLRQRRQ